MPARAAANQVGITAFGAYIPRSRLGKDTKGWGLGYEKAVANFDEDSVTLSVAAGVDCLRGIDRSKVDGVIFATTTSPYAEQQGAATIATALDLRRDIFTTDVTNTLRAGSDALRQAVAAVRAGSAEQVLVAVADVRLAMPQSELDRNFGDGAASFLIGKGPDLIASIDGESTLSEHMVDTWRSSSEPFVRSWEERFVLEEGYQRILPEAVAGLFKKLNLTPAAITKACLYAPDARRHADMAKRLGLAAQQVQDPLMNNIGNTGAASALLMLAAALEAAKPGDRLLLATYGSGADAIALTAQEGVSVTPTGRRGVSKHLASKAVLPDYATYLKWHELVPEEPPKRPLAQPLSIAALLRERDQNIRLYGARCKSCGRIQYPPQRVCVFCRARDSYEHVRLSDKLAEVFTYSMDYLAGTKDIPLVIAILNMQGGGRILAMMTDRLIEEVKIGMTVEMSFRKISVNTGVHNYYWKCVPLRA